MSTADERIVMAVAQALCPMGQDESENGCGNGCVYRRFKRCPYIDLSRRAIDAYRAAAPVGDCVVIPHEGIVR